MYMKIAAQLDDLAGRLEAQGLLKEAEEIDVIANTLEVLAYQMKTTDPIYAKTQKSLNFLTGKEKVPPATTPVAGAIGLLQSLTSALQARIRGFADNPKLLQGFKSVQQDHAAAIASLDDQNTDQAAAYLAKALSTLEGMGKEVQESLVPKGKTAPIPTPQTTPFMQPAGF